MRGLYFILALITGATCSFGQVSDSILLEILSSHASTFESSKHPNGIQTITRFENRNESNHKFALKSVLKEPSKLRYSYMLNGIKIDIGYNGKSGWQRRESEGKIVIDDYVPGAFDWLKTDASFHNHLISAHRGNINISLTLEPKVEIDGRLCNVVLATDGSELRFRYYLIAVSGSLVRQEIENSAGELINQSRYSDFRKVDGLQMPHKIAVYKNGELQSSSQITEIILNDTIYDFLFEKPNF